MISHKKSDVVRLQKLLKNDYFHIPDETVKLLNRDLYRLLSSYFDDLTDFDLKVDFSDEYNITFTARASSVKDLKVL